MDSTPDNSVVLYMVSRHANINEKDNYGCTPLHFAAMRGNELVTYELLQCPGVDIGVRAVSMRAISSSVLLAAMCSAVMFCLSVA